MKLLLAILVALVFCYSAAAAYQIPKLNQVSGIFAMHKETVLCYDPGEPGDPYSMGAWGYVLTYDRTTVNLTKEMCDGIVAVIRHDTSIPAWERAVGVLVLVHESYHARYWAGNNSEALVECKAIRHWAYGMKFLGATPQEIQQLLPYALAFHFREEEKFREYDLHSCNTPWYYPPGGPRK